MKIAVVTSTPSLFEFVESCFPDNCFLIRFEDDLAVTRAIIREDFDAILLDAYQGFDSQNVLLARRECQSEWRVPLIAFGAVPGNDGLEKAFNAGVDEVVTAPLDAKELYVRTRRVMQRFNKAQDNTRNGELCFGSYNLYRSTASVRIGANEKPTQLTTREFAIAWLLFSRQGEYITRRHLAATIWGTTEEIIGRSLEQHIYKLRKKLGLNGEHGARLTTLYAHGYRIEADGTPPVTVSKASKADVFYGDWGGLTRHDPALLALHSGSSTIMPDTRFPTMGAASGTPPVPKRCMPWSPPRPVRAVHSADTPAAYTAKPWNGRDDTAPDDDCDVPRLPNPRPPRRA